MSTTPTPRHPIHYLHYHLPDYSPPLLIIWSLLTAVISLTGNTCILVGTIKHGAIKLDTISLLLIKNLAVSDILNTLLVVLPGVATLSTRSALFSDSLIVCHVLSNLQYVFGVFNSLAVCIMMVNKLIILLNPISTLSRSERTGHCLVTGAWVCGLVPALLYLAVGGTTVMFDTRVYRFAARVCF